MWDDSGITYLQQMPDPEKIKASISRGIFFAKIGSKITETSQPLDVDLFFQVLNKCGRSMTSVRFESHIGLLVDIIFKDKENKVLLLSTLKEHTLKDCISITPEMISSSFSKKNNFTLLRISWYGRRKGK